MSILTWIIIGYIVSFIVSYKILIVLDKIVSGEIDRKFNVPLALIPVINILITGISIMVKLLALFIDKLICLWEQKSRLVFIIKTIGLIIQKIGLLFLVLIEDFPYIKKKEKN